MHSFTLGASHTVFYFLFFSPCPQGLGGFPVTWVLDSPSHVLTLVLTYLVLSLQAISFQFPHLGTHLALPFSCSCSQALSLGWVSCPYYLRVCSMFVTGQLCRKEGRLMTTEICSDSGPVQTVPMGSMCFLASVECQRTPIQRLSPPSQTQAPHSGKGSPLWVHVCGPMTDKRNERKACYM